MIPAADLARLAAYCGDNGIRLVSDEIYHGITYESAPRTPAPSAAIRSSSTRSRILQHEPAGGSAGW